MPGQVAMCADEAAIARVALSNQAAVVEALDLNPAPELAFVFLFFFKVS